MAENEKAAPVPQWIELALQRAGRPQGQHLQISCYSVTAAGAASELLDRLPIVDMVKAAGGAIQVLLTARNVRDDGGDMSRAIAAVAIAAAHDVLAAGDVDRVGIIEELQAIDAELDRCGAPRAADGRRLTLEQRVRVLGRDLSTAQHANTLARTAIERVHDSAAKAARTLEVAK